MSHSQLLDFISFVQNFHPVVNFTYDISEKLDASLDMDISLKQGEGQLTTSAHYKATDSHSYLDYSSSHNTNNIPSSQFLRLHYLCSNDTDFEENAEEMVEFLIQRHYQEDIVKTILQKVKTIQYQHTLQPNNKTDAQKRHLTQRQHSHISLFSCCLSNIFPSTGQENNIAQPKTGKWFIFDRLTVV